MQKGKHCAKNTFVRATKKRLFNITKIRNPSKNLLPKRIKVTKRHKIATSIDNIVKNLANTRELQTELTEHTIKLLISTYNYNKYFLLGRLKLLKDEKNMPIFLSFTDKI